MLALLEVDGFGVLGEAADGESALELAYRIDAHAGWVDEAGRPVQLPAQDDDARRSVTLIDDEGLAGRRTRARPGGAGRSGHADHYAHIHRGMDS